MSNRFKKITATAVAAACVLSLSGCSDSGYIGEINGMQIPTGIYLFDVVFTAYNEASTQLSEEQEESGSTAEINVLSSTIDGKSASEWLKDKALETMKRYVAIESLFDEYGLTLSTEDTEAIDEYIGSLDDDLGYYAMYYGIDESTFAEYYENRGISSSSLRSLSENSYKEDDVFLHLYDTDGISAVTDEEIDEYATENYAAVKYLKVEFTDYQGLALSDEAEIQEVKELAQAWVDRLNSGEDWTQIQYEYDLRAAWYSAWLEASDAYAEAQSSTAEASSTAESSSDTESESETAAAATAQADASTAEASTATADASTAEASATTEAGTAEASTTEASEEASSVTAPVKPVVSSDDTEYNEYCQAAIDAVTVEKAESADDSEVYVSKASSTLDESLTEYIWNLTADSTASLYEDSENNCVYVVMRDDITTMTSWKEEQHETILHALKDDEFEEFLKETYAQYTVELDDYLVNTKYAPEKLKGIGE